jgi:hypothetical protein
MGQTWPFVLVEPHASFTLISNKFLVTVFAVRS